MYSRTSRVVNALSRWQRRADRAGFPVALAVILVAAAAMVGAVSLLAVVTSTLTLMFAAAIGALSTGMVLGSIFVALAAADDDIGRVAERRPGPERRRSDCSAQVPLGVRTRAAVRSTPARTSERR